MAWHAMRPMNAIARQVMNAIAQAPETGTAAAPILQRGTLRHREHSVACPRPQAGRWRD